jgi:broad specificity phosphatase PhoE
MEANKILREKWGSDIGGVVVSPLKRALQTTEGALKGI